MSIASRLRELEMKTAWRLYCCSACGEPIAIADADADGNLHCVHCHHQFSPDEIPPGNLKIYQDVCDGEKSETP